MSNRRRSRDRFSSGADTNPMDSLSNLADVMLVFAVGLMLSIIMHYNVNVSAQEGATPDAQTTSASQAIPEDAETFTEEDREQMRQDATEGLPTDSIEKTAEVYYDASTDTYYIVENRGEES